MKDYQYREVLVDERKLPGRENKVFNGYFHQFGIFGEGDYQETKAIVEDRDSGEVFLIHPEALKFRPMNKVS